MKTTKNINQKIKFLETLLKRQQIQETAAAYLISFFILSAFCAGVWKLI